MIWAWLGFVHTVSCRPQRGIKVRTALSCLFKLELVLKVLDGFTVAPLLFERPPCPYHSQFTALIKSTLVIIDAFFCVGPAAVSILPSSLLMFPMPASARNGEEA
jgi:hypothetical protein